MKTCLIIGIDSFTGKYIAEAFAHRGTYTVVGTTRIKNNLNMPYVSKILKMDLLDYFDVSSIIESIQPDFIIHLAGVSFAANNNVSQYYDVHVVGTRNVFRAIEEHDVPVSKLILASTGQVYGLAKNISEKTPLIPVNDYSISKLAMEYTAKIWQDKVPIIIARPFNYIGIGQASHFVIPKIISAFVSKSEELVLGRTDVKRDFSDVRFIAQCYLTLVEHGNTGEIYNLASGVSHSINYLIEQLSLISGNKLCLRHDEQFIRKKEPEVVMVDNSKILALSESIDEWPIDKTLKWIFDYGTRR